MTHLLILGAGFSGKAIGQAFKAAGFSVSGTTRSAEKAEDLRALGRSRRRAAIRVSFRESLAPSARTVDMAI